jgi:phage-related protein
VKDVIFLGTSQDDLRQFPEEVRRAAGFELWRVQCGLAPSDWKPMPSVGPGVAELRVRADGAFRVVYLATRPEGVYVLHCFQKKAQKTPRPDIELARARLKLIGGHP